MKKPENLKILAFVFKRLQNPRHQGFIMASVVFLSI